MGFGEVKRSIRLSGNNTTKPFLLKSSFSAASFQVVSWSCVVFPENVLDKHDLGVDRRPDLIDIGLDLAGKREFRKQFKLATLIFENLSKKSFSYLIHSFR